MGTQTAGTSPAPPGHIPNRFDRYQEHLLAGIRMTEMLIKRDEDWIALVVADDSDVDSDWRRSIEHRRQSIEQRQAHLHMLQHRAMRAGALNEVTVKYPERLRLQEQLEDDVADKGARLPKHVQRRFRGRALIDLAHDRTFNRIVEQYAPQAATVVRRPRSRDRRPRTPRRTSSSSATSGADPTRPAIPSQRLAYALPSGATMRSTVPRRSGSVTTSGASSPARA